jgi:hypothetical protein
MRSCGILLVASALSAAIGGCIPWGSYFDTDGGTNAAPGTYGFCEAVTATCTAAYGGPAAAEEYLLGEPASCVQAASDQCATLEATYSAAFQSAVVDCARHYSPCDASFNDCVGLQTAGTPPTQVQAKVEADFCSTFVLDDDPNASCSDYFKVIALGNNGVPGDEQTRTDSATSFLPSTTISPREWVSASRRARRWRRAPTEAPAIATTAC